MCGEIVAGHERVGSGMKKFFLPLAKHQGPAAAHAQCCSGQDVPEKANDTQGFTGCKRRLPGKRRLGMRMQKIYGHIVHAHFFKTEGKINTVMPAFPKAEQAAGTGRHTRLLHASHSIAALAPGLRGADAWIKLA